MALSVRYEIRGHFPISRSHFCIVSTDSLCQLTYLFSVVGRRGYNAEHRFGGHSDCYAFA
jgi:hypothetical protein